MRVPKRWTMEKPHTIFARGVAFVLALSVWLCAPAALAQDVGLLAQLEREWVYADTQRFLSEALDWAMDRAPIEEKPMLVGDWFLHPAGFAFRVPDGLEVIGRYKSADILLVDESETNASFRTNISIVIGKQDDTIYDLTEQKITAGYNSQFSRFKLRGFDVEERFGVDCVRISFVYNESPQLFTQQYLFTKYDHTYYVTLTTENTLRGISNGLALLSQLSESMLFRKEAETGAR